MSAKEIGYEELISSSDNNGGSNRSNNKKCKSHKAIVIVTLSLIIVSLIIVGFVYFVFVKMPIIQSQKAFESASEFEKAGDYQEALTNYKNVIIQDKENYTISVKKIAEIDNIIKINKDAAKYALALLHLGYAKSLDDIFSLAVSSEKATCRIDGIGYVISREKMEPFKAVNATYSSVQYDLLTELYVSKFKAEFFYNGWLTDVTNDVIQTGADATFQMQQLMTEEKNVRINLIRQYLDEYEKNRDLSIFE